MRTSTLAPPKIPMLKIEFQKMKRRSPDVL
jgi:hypothetical protein